MRAGRAIVTLSLFITCTVVATPYKLKESFVGDGFRKAFTWWTYDDPTHGRVNFVDEDTAFARNLSYVSESKFVMRADSFNKVPPNSRGRDSVRISSNEAYIEGVMVLDIVHMPEGCATWPAFWTVTKAGQWPHGGEIDIIEGVNMNQDNLVSLHTSPNCHMPLSRKQTGSIVTTNCDASVNNNQGCGTSFTQQNSFGKNFNDIGGGWYVMERSTQVVNVWFIPRNDPNVPKAIRYGLASSIDPIAFNRRPDVQLSWNQCDYGTHFDPHSIIFDLTFCGDWAGSVFSSSGCGYDCNAYVDQNPSAFQNAYWEINSLRIFTPYVTDGLIQTRHLRKFEH